MFKSPDPIRGIVVGTGVMLLLALPRTLASWDDLASGAYSSLWFIWPMIGSGLTAMGLAAWRTWKLLRADVTAAAEAPEEGPHWDREGH